ncbi:MAG TPA: MFS transporter [Tepidisphaeraceae bacterium]|nr:MFS transporter [Tepidisphaeraceae bacterium]
MSLLGADPVDSSLAPAQSAPADQALRLGDISAEQWKTGIAAWLGWLFDGLDMHLYTLVAAPFVATLLHMAADSAEVKHKSAWIQAAFLVGWALGGGFFGRLGDRLGRSRALGLTILTYAAFTGLSFFAQTWWQLMAFRFLAALGIGGEWAVGSALLAETWPAHWRPWAAAVLQTAVNIGVLIACVVTYLLANHERGVFLVGIVPALAVFWIRRSVPEPLEWRQAKERSQAAGRERERELQRDSVQTIPPLVQAADASGPPVIVYLHPAPEPGMADLFRGPVRLLTVRTIIVCACSLTAWWGFMFWINQLVLNLPDIAGWSDAQRKHLVSESFFLLIGTSIAGNFFAALLAKALGYRRAIALMFLGFFAAMIGAFCIPRDHVSLLLWVPWVGFFSGVFGLFTMYLPPLFPTLLRTTGAGFSYNIGRLAAAAGTVFFGMFATLKGQNLRMALLWNAFLFVPAMLVALTLPELKDTPVREPG